ncbi:hypothetical protein [Xenorhabdus doucetiae]|uniref:hypothetical protein n=1 Tax=Xenorhabdus doucetiae TaxID=351671 RepID=UPI0008FFBF34|nr:hypothetical protein [Xenorhabdus doucetiae]
MQPPQGASLEQNPLSCKHSVVPERSVPQSVAGAPLAGSVPPAPAERPPAAQTSWATFARCRKGNRSQNPAVQPIMAENRGYTAFRRRAKKS